MGSSPPRPGPLPLYPTMHPPSVTLEELKSFHKIDRALYAKLVFQVKRDLNESMLIMALWLWLERANPKFKALVERIVALPEPFIGLLAEEAVQCISSILVSPYEHSNVNYSDELIPMTRNFSCSNITLNMLHENRWSASHEVSTIYYDVCLKIFPDIASQAEQHKAALFNAESSKRENNEEVEGFRASSSSLDESRMMQQRFGEPKTAFYPDDRTIFMTFSKGYPVLVDDISEFITRKHGDCIEAIHMHEVPEGEQPLHAKLVTKTAAAVQMILEGQENLKFLINGKHVRVRRYVSFIK